MTPDRTEQLIVDLAANMAPVPRLASLPVRLTQWLATAWAVTAVAMWLIGMRADLSRAITTPDVLVSLGLACLASVAAAGLALRLSVPGADQSAWVRWTPFTLAAIWLAVLVQATAQPVSSLAAEPFHAACVIRIVALSFIPSLVLLRGVRQGFALDHGWAASLAILGGATLAAVAVQLLCPIDRPAHLLVSHALPALTLLAAVPLAVRVLTTHPE